MQTIMADSIKTQNMYMQRELEIEKQAKKKNEEFLADTDRYVKPNENADFFYFED